MDSFSAVERFTRTVLPLPAHKRNMHTTTQQVEEHEQPENGIILLLNGDHEDTFCSTSLCYAAGQKAKAIDYAPSQLQNSRSCTQENSCNGLLCFSKSRGLVEQVFLCNPSLKENITLPDITSTSKPKPFCQKYGLGFSPISNEYKVLRVSSDPSVQGKIYTLGTESWRDLASVPPQPFYGKPVSSYANGSLSWKVDTDMCQTEDRIISFDIEREIFYVTKHPQLGSERNDMIDLIQLRGELAIVDYSSDTHIHIWVTNPMFNLWEKEYILKINPFDESSNNRGFKVIGLWQQGEILLTWNDNSFYSYDPMTNDIKYIHNVIEPRPFTIITEVYGYTKSSVSLQPYGFEEL